jgi:hypothetical protein
MNKRAIVAVFVGVGLAAVIILTACRPSPVYQATSLPATSHQQPAITHTITLDIRTYDPAFPPLAGGTEGGRDVPAHAVFELPLGRTHFLGPRFTVQVLAEQETRFTVHAPGYAPIDKTMVPHYQRDAHLSMEVPLTPAELPVDDAQILAMMREAVEGIGYGFAPLLLDEGARVVIEGDASADTEIAYLTYPIQAADPLNWQTMDCFAYAYAVRRHLLSEFPVEAGPELCAGPCQGRGRGVADVALALVELPSALGDDYAEQTARHVFAWITFADGHVAALDLTPLAAEPVNPRHTPVMLVNQAAGLESQFDAWRRRVSLRKAQPMLTVERSGTLYYLLAGVNVLDDEYQFTLRASETQPATADQPLRFARGALAGLRFKREEFAQVQAMVRDDGPDAFHVKGYLLIRQGDPDPDLAAVLDDHLHLLWHLVAKLQPKEANP